MGFKYWHGIKVNADLDDALLERVYSIPGIAITDLIVSPEGDIVQGLAFTFYPPDGAPDETEVNHAFAGIGRVAVDEKFGQPRFVIGTPKGIQRPELAAWWNTFIERLTYLAALQRPPTIDDFERDIIRGASFVFAGRREKHFGSRQAIAAPTPDSDLEAKRFLEAMSALNGKSVYELYLDYLRRIGPLNVQFFRIMFGGDAAFKGIGHQPQNNLAGLKVPVWWSVVPGTFDVCVLKFPANAIGNIGIVLLAHAENATVGEFNIKVDKEGDFIDCTRLSTFSKEYADMRATAAKIPGSSLRCEAMPGNRIADFIASLYEPWHKEKIQDVTERSLAICFARE